MRAAPVKPSDEMLEQACPAFVEGEPSAALSNPAVRAVVEAAVRAQMAPRRPSVLSRRIAAPLPVPRHGAIDAKRRAANDFDEE
jgi:hypothetical protein